MSRFLRFAAILTLAGLCVVGGWFLRDVTKQESEGTIPREAAHERPKPWVEPGWEYVRKRYRNVVRFHFGDRADTQFIGLCDSRPVFFLNGGDYRSMDNFELTIDGHSWTLPAFQGEHGRGLFVDDPQFVEPLTKASKRISFRVSDWVRAFKPGPELAWFVQQCREIRRRDPDSMGVGSDLQPLQQ